MERIIVSDDGHLPLPGDPTSVEIVEPSSGPDCNITSECQRDIRNTSNPLECNDGFKHEENDITVITDSDPNEAHQDMVQKNIERSKTSPTIHTVDSTPTLDWIPDEASTTNPVSENPHQCSSESPPSDLSLPILFPSHLTSGSGDGNRSNEMEQDTDLEGPSSMPMPMPIMDDILVKDIKDRNRTCTHHKSHEHVLCLEQRTDFHTLICDLCSTVFQGRSWHCAKGCDYDICMDCIEVEEQHGAASNERDIGTNHAVPIKTESRESSEEKPRRRRGRKRKRRDNESESERDQRRKLQKLDRDTVPKPQSAQCHPDGGSESESEFEPEGPSENEGDDGVDPKKQCGDFCGDFRSFYNVNCNSLQCTDCDKSFKFHQDFIDHMKAEHTELSPYKCHLCTKKYRHRKSLMDHYKGKHQEKKTSHRTISTKKKQDDDLNNSVSTDSQSSGQTDTSAPMETVESMVEEEERQRIEKEAEILELAKDTMWRKIQKGNSEATSK